MRPFYINENFNIVFPKRGVYDREPHEVWFKDEGIPSIGIIKGYFHNDHISVFTNDFDIPPLHPGIIMDWFNSYTNLFYVELGANRVGDKYIPKLVVFKGGQLNLGETLATGKENGGDSKEEKPEELENGGNEDDSEEREDKDEDKTENLIEESIKIGNKKKIGFQI